MAKPIANILTNSKRVNIKYKFNKCKTLEETNTSLPTLIIGYENAKKYIKNFDILTKNQENTNIWWTFSKTENNSEYEEDLSKFNEVIINQLIKDIKYKLIDLIQITKFTKRKILKWLISDSKKLLYNLNNNFLFILDKKEKIIYGLSLTTLRYFGGDDKILIKKLLKYPHNELIEDFNAIPIDIRRTIGDNIHYLVGIYENF